MAPARQAEVAPYRYPVKHPVSAAEARKNYQELLRKINSVRIPADKDQPDASSKYGPFDCPGLDGSTRQCVGEGRSNYYVGEYLPYTSNEPALVPDSPASSTMVGGAAEPGWVPAEKVVGGQDVLKRLDASLEKKSLEDCDDRTGECKTVVEATPAASGERALAICGIARVGEEVGAARNCEEVAIIAPEMNYIRAVVAYTPGRVAVPTAPDEWSATVEYRIERESPEVSLPNLSTVLDALRRGLSTADFKLKTGLFPKDAPARVVGVAGPRPAPHFHGLGVEKVSVAVDVNQEGGGALSIKAYFSVLVRHNNEVSSRPVDFRLPTEAEMLRYKETFDSSVKIPLSSLCEKYRFTWKDFTTLVCLK